ncbi:MAG: protein kinase, partial [Chloroflexota bacterium]
MELAEGVRVGPYTLVRKLGEGGFGVVWQAQDDRLGRAVAMKFIKPAFAHDTLLREDFQREARAVSQLDHPNILTVHDIGEQDGAAYMVT